jgi:putative transposase
MARLRFTVGTRFLLKEYVYIVREILLEQKLLVENLSFGGKVIFTQAELAAAWDAKELIFEIFGRNLVKEEIRPIATQYTIADFQNLDGVPYKEAWRRYKLLLPLLRIPEVERTRKTIKKYVQQMQKEQLQFPIVQKLESSQQPIDVTKLESLSKAKRSKVGEAVSWASMERWLKAFEQSNYDIRALLPAIKEQGGKHEQRLNEETERIITAVLGECRLHPAHRTAYDIYLQVINLIREENLTRPSKALPLPSPVTIWRRIQVVGPEVILHRSPSHLTKQAQANSEVHNKPTRILERVEIDHTVLDFIVVDEEDRLPIGRPTLTFALDVYSGFPFGFYLGFEPASYLTVQQCLLMGILPKLDCQALYATKNPWPVYGLPETLIVDNGKEFIGRDLADACAQLGIILEQMPVKKPWYKGAIERHFRTNNTGLLHLLPGSTMSNILARVDYDPMRDACISLKALVEVLYTFWLDIDAQKWHKGVNGIPAKMWEESIRAGWLPTLHQNSTEVRILLYRSTERTLRREGIFFQSLRYQHPKLAYLRSKIGADTQVHIKYDPSDLSAVYVVDPESANGWLKVPSTNPEYTDRLTLWKHKIVREYVLRRKHQVNILDLAEAKAHIQKIVNEEFILTRKSRGRKIAARFLGVGTEIGNESIPSGTFEKTIPNLPPALPVTMGKAVVDNITKDSEQLEVETIITTESVVFGTVTNPPNMKQSCKSSGEKKKGKGKESTVVVQDKTKSETQLSENLPINDQEQTVRNKSAVDNGNSHVISTSKLKKAPKNGIVAKSQGGHDDIIVASDLNGDYGLPI